MSEQPQTIFTEAERCPRCKGTGFIGKAVDVGGNPIEQPQDTTGLPSCPSCGLIDGLHQDYCYYKQPQQEWTPDKVIMMGVDDYAIAHNIADAHNAALDIAREEWKLTRLPSLERALAAEREKLIDAVADREMYALQRGELAHQLAEYKLTIRELEQQLAAEHQKRKDSDAHFIDACKQLADEREKLKGELANGATLFRKTVELEKQLADEREAHREWLEEHEIQRKRTAEAEAQVRQLAKVKEGK